jgi:hypothetical protein
VREVGEDHRRGSEVARGVGEIVGVQPG